MAATKQAEENKDLVRRLIEELGEKRNLDILDETHASDFEIHSPLAPGGKVTGREAYKATLQEIFDAFSDMTLIIEDIVAEDDMVAYRLSYTATHEGEFMDVPPTGKRVSWEGMAFLRIEDGTVREIRAQTDTIGLMQQLGVTEVPGEH